jgi:hypothetical protein
MAVAVAVVVAGTAEAEVAAGTAEVVADISVVAATSAGVGVADSVVARVMVVDFEAGTAGVGDTAGVEDTAGIEVAMDGAEDMEVGVGVALALDCISRAFRITTRPFGMAVCLTITQTIITTNGTATWVSMKP